MPHIHKDAVVWTELPVVDIQKAVAFYNDVFDLEMTIDESGVNPVAMFPTADKDGVAGHLYPGKPPVRGTGSTVHFAVPDTVEETSERVRKAGGEVFPAIIPIPAGRFCYALDLDGNSIGLFETSKG